ncbi:alpha-mannosidase 2-like isoform X2 [Lineus longissimus]|uniref:alpha-mannosidase 2-like isoform X2 n=1 Tax=Lineus longissimus TaxID=88925 RepID=UPI002B4F83A9
MKKYVALLGAGMFCVVCLSMYMMLESTQWQPKLGDMDQIELNNLEYKIKSIESILKRNQKTINLIKDTVKDLSDGDAESISRLKGIFNDDAIVKMNQEVAAPKNQNGGGKLVVAAGPRRVIGVPAGMCTFAETPALEPKVQMLDVFNTIPFDNNDGGVWKQGFPITYPLDQWNEQPLKVFVVPHSHNDPGWIKTYEKYYQDQTKFIFENMLPKLEADKRRKFIYAEMSFLNLWWNDIDESKRKRLKNLIDNGQLEIVTGGWVMNDEANTHYFSMIDQMIEGHEWLKNQLGAKPVSGWAIDPFGHSSTMAYLLKKMGLKNMLIQRIHYSVKKHLAKNKELEFMWRQTWDHSGGTDIFTHMMPFYSYDVPHTCGPDPKICCQFDFKRLPGGTVSCPWRVPPQLINDGNIEERAHTLLDQYRKKAQLYKSNVVLIPLGDDFRYNTGTEWDQQFINYQKLMDYMNKKKDWNVQIQFGTLTDYFNAIYERNKVQPGASVPDYPTLSGDFFTYADRDDHYWSGYYTSRPFHKRLDRVLEGHLRGAEIIFTLAQSLARKVKNTGFPVARLMKALVSARRYLGLFQHHDGITGTAKDNVVVDYGNKMLKSLMDTKSIIVESAAFLLNKNPSAASFNDDKYVFNVDEKRESHDDLPDKTVISITSTPICVVFYNSLSVTHDSLVRIYVSSPYIKITDEIGQIVEAQTDPYWLNNEDMSNTVYKVVFVAKVPAMGLVKYTLTLTGTDEAAVHNKFSTVTMYNVNSHMAYNSGPFSIVKKLKGETFSLENPYVKAEFNGGNGMLTAITNLEDHQRTETNVQFLKYGTRNGREKPGAYLFLPDGEATPLAYTRPFIRVVKGPLLQEAHVFLPHVEHIVRLKNSPGIDGMAVEVHNIVDIRGTVNMELAMSVQTSIRNKDKEFFTDLNGFQMIRRKKQDKLPIQANYYPLPSQAYLQDDEARFSILTAQSLGVASLKQGQIEVMLDRRLNQDDNRGLGQGVLDNRRTPNKFLFLAEKKQTNKKPSPLPVGYPSITSHLLANQLVHPVFVLPQNPDASAANLVRIYKPLERDLPCDIHLLNLRSMQNAESNPDIRFRPKETAALLLHRLGFDCQYPGKGLKCEVSDSGQLHISKLFKDFNLARLQEVSLSLLHDGKELDPSDMLEINAMEINSYKVELK